MNRGHSVTVDRAHPDVRNDALTWRLKSWARVAALVNTLQNLGFIPIGTIPTEKISTKNLGLPRYSPPRYQPVYLHRNSQTLNEVFQNQLKPRNARTAGFAGFEKPHLRSDYFGISGTRCNAVPDHRTDEWFQKT